MDTKWKNGKKAISFIIFFLGVSLTLGSIARIVRNKPSGVRLWQLNEILEKDYQKSARFREYIANCLENFLAMATGGVPVNTGEYDYYIYYGNDYGVIYDGGYYYDDYYYDSNYYSGYYGDTSSYYDSYYDDGSGYYEDYGIGWEDEKRQLQDLENALEEMQDAYFDILEEAEGNQEQYEEELEAYREQLEACRRELEEYRSSIKYDSSEEYREQGRRAFSEEQKKKIAENYHDRLKSDKNLLYTVLYDGKVLYSNSDFLTPEVGLQAPDGYNFLLYFDGEKVRIIKDGKELDVYGDGYYRDGSNGHSGSDWYVPGYRNFPVDEKIKKVNVYIAAAKEPIIYTEGVYGNIGSRQLGNSLYWMNYYFQSRQKLLLNEVAYLALGAALLFLSFLLRKSRREAVERIASFQAKIWVEWKALLLIGFLYGLFTLTIRSNREYGIWRELSMEYAYNYDIDTIIGLGLEAVKSIPSVLWIILFWLVYFIWIDLRHNKKVWRHGFIARLYRLFSVKTLKQPLSRKMAYRNAAIFAAAAIYGFLMAGIIISGMSGYKKISRTGALAILVTVCFWVAAYMISKKNRETAKDMETLSQSIGEIRNGNYTDISGEFSGHDLEEIMVQLEDIRHGMAKAVDEQMKSERMKVELIANVSHDIKTPLTSIISYIQFLKQEEGLPEHVKDYVMILDEKSQRLKNMVQDVFAVSKAASGELPMHMEKLDFGKLLYQTMADMEEQIDNSAVAFRTEIPESPVMIMADGQRMYRVFQNLFQNAIKYSLDGSRVYVALKTDGPSAITSVKNTSCLELDKNRDFAERFARGDQSRTDGGSGLGLSIAQSFTEACGGKFSWETDADLFVVRVSFKTI